MSISVLHGDCLEILPTLAECSVDACVTDPPYHLTSIVKRFAKTNRGDDTKTSDRSRRKADGYARLSTGFMGKAWDGGDIAFRPETWAEVFRVLKPGAHLIAFGGTRTYHRLACAIEDAGFEIRDQIMWIYGSGFPKSLDVSKAIDKAAGAGGTFGERKANIHSRGDHVLHEGWRRPWMDDPAAIDKSGREYFPATDAARKWQGWGTALKPSFEPCVLARKPLIGTVAANVLAHGTGGLNIDGCRVETFGETPRGSGDRRGGNIYAQDEWTRTKMANGGNATPPAGRWPANVIHDGSDEVVGAFPATDSMGHIPRSGGTKSIWSNGREIETDCGSNNAFADSGSAARFFYSAKADKDDRLSSKHPTVKPVDLMAYLCRLVTPPGGTVLDPFAGSGSTGMACMREGFDAILIEREAEYVTDIRRRIAHVSGQDAPLFAGAAE